MIRDGKKYIVHDAVEFVNGAKFHLIGKLVYFWGPGMVVYKGGNDFLW
jgi:hypothetical protein